MRHLYLLLALLLAAPAAHAQLNGFYTIGGASPDYATIADAVADLNAVGVSGPTRFAIRGGVYTEQLSIGAIAGVSATDSVQFRSANPSNRATIQFDATAGANYVWRLQDADHVTFRNLDFVETGTDANARLLVIEGDADDVRVDGCTFIGLAGATTDDGSLLSAETNTADRLEVENSTFTNGYRGINAGPPTTPYPDGHVYRGNTFDDQYDAAIYVSAIDGAVITQNVISDGAGSSAFYIGIEVGLADASEISRNDIRVTQGRRGISTSLTAQKLIANNMVSLRSPNGQAGIYLDGNAYRVDVLHNTVRVGSATGTGVALLRRSFSTTPLADIDIKNNLFLHYASGTALEIEDPANVDSLDYNNLFRTGGGTLVAWGGTNYATLAAYQSGTGQGTNSVSKGVTFVSASGGDLHLAGASDGDNDLAGTLLAEVPDDLDGETRGDPPYMGADEAATPLGTAGPDYDLAATNTTSLTATPGGSVSFDYTITNNTAASATGNLWYTASPGSVSGVILSGTINAGETIAGSYTQNIPANAPPGTYTYTLRIGQFPSPTLDAEVFTLTVTPGPRAARADADAEWTVSDVSEWTVVGEVVASADGEGPVEASSSAAVPEAFALHAAYPNPFNPATTVRFDVPEAADVRVEVLDLLGRRVALLTEGRVEAGTHSVRFEAQGVSSGVYLVRMYTEHFQAVRRVTLLQ